MGFRVVDPAGLEWITRPHEPGEPARHVAELSDAAGFAHTRANVWRYEPGAKGRRHRHPIQEETFVVLSGALSMYLGEPPEVLADLLRRGWEQRPTISVLAEGDTCGPDGCPI